VPATVVERSPRSTPGSLRRSIALVRHFRAEQTDPDRFYRYLAKDSVDQLAQWAPISGATLLDVGGGPGYFRDAFVAAGARYVGIDSDVGELTGRGEAVAGAVIGTALALPVGTGTVDIAYSSNVLEHVAQPERMAAEMLRVTRPGGLVALSYTLWLSPWGGHETSPWHYLGGERAARRYERRHGKPPKNRYGESLFAVSAGRMLRWSREQQGAQVVATLPRYHPWWACWVSRVPGLRELATWNLLLVLRRT
jgi:arabinofuranan 3-O-arabinosyltransferase